MTQTAAIDIIDRDLTASLNNFFKSILTMEAIGGILIPAHLPAEQTIMPMLITDPDRLDRADALAPCFPLNASKLVSRLTRKPTGHQVVAVLRPCEIRAYTELIKLKQGNPEDVVLLGIDCLGAFNNREYRNHACQADMERTSEFCAAILTGNDPEGYGNRLASACKSCEHPIPEGADIVIGLYGVDRERHVPIFTRTEKGDALIRRLQLSQIEIAETRDQVVEALLEKRKQARDRMFESTRLASDNLEKLTTYLSACVNCYNCRVACPVCYCRECVFVTDVFDHEPYQYLRWAERKGAVKMPTDTVFYHITRLAHMSTACVGCGQCSNACPNDIPVMELFRCASHVTQAAFGYEAGRSRDEPPPLSVFREGEFMDLTADKARAGRP